MKNNHSPLVVACPVMKNNKNISMIARSAGCFGANKLIITGQNKIESNISRDCNIEIENHRSILPVISKYKTEGYKIIGLERSSKSVKLNNYHFIDIPILLVIGNECKGIDPEIMDCLDEIIEITLFGKPDCLNVAVAVSVFLYEYSKQMNKEIGFAEYLYDYTKRINDEYRNANVINKRTV